MVGYDRSSTASPLYQVHDQGYDRGGQGLPVLLTLRVRRFKSTVGGRCPRIMTRHTAAAAVRFVQFVFVYVEHHRCCV